MLGNIPIVRGKDKDLPSFLITFSRCEHIFISPCQCQISQQLRSLESTFLSLSTGQVPIPCQLYLRPNTKKITHISKPGMASLCFCSRWWETYCTCVTQFPASTKTQQVGISTSCNYNYSHCFEKWVGPNYLLPFQVSVKVFVLGYKV